MATTTTTTPHHDPPVQKSVVKIRNMTIDDLSPVFELGDKIYPAELYPNLFRMWSEAEVVESFGKQQEEKGGGGGLFGIMLWSLRHLLPLLLPSTLTDGLWD